MSSSHWDLEELMSWVGREVTYTAPEELGRAAIRYFALAIGDMNPLYLDDAFARQNGHDGVIAPPTLVCETNQYMTGERDGDGYLGHTWDPPVTDCRLIRGGNSYEFLRPVSPTDVISSTWKISDITEKPTRSGSMMLTVVSEVTYSNQRGELLAVDRETNLYQPIAAEAT